MYGRPSLTPWSRIWTTCGLLSCAAAFASRSKRCCASGKLARASARIGASWRADSMRGAITYPTQLRRRRSPIMADHCHK